MADASMALRLTTAERQLVHGVCYFAAAVMHDPHLDVLADRLRELALNLAERPETASAIGAALELTRAYPRRNHPGGANDWVLANFAAGRVALQFHWRAFVALDGG